MDGYRTLARLGLFVGLIGVELWLARDLSSNGGVMGYTLTKSHAVAPPRRAKIRTLDVQLGAPVAAGQLLAQLDPTQVDDEIAAAAAERQHALAAIQAEIAKQRREKVDLSRRFETGAERASAELVGAEAGARTAAAELAALETEIANQRDLVQRHLANAEMLGGLELKRAALAKQVGSAEQVLAVLRGNASAATRRAGLAGGDGGGGSGGEPDAVLAPLEAQLHVAELRLDQLARDRAALSLRAPVDGVIEQLPLRPGELAGPEAPVAIVVASDTSRVVACVPEVRSSSIEVGTEVETTSTFDHARGTGAVESLTSEIAPLPPRCQPPAGRPPLLGRLAVVALDAPNGGLPGKTQIVHFQARRRPRVPPPAKEVPAAVSTTPARMRMPGALLARSRFEPSGLAWVPALDRYVIVSDDTGFKDRDDRAPWLFTMAADGAIDPEPLVVSGIDALDDIEAIALDADQKLWLLSSHSVSKKGNRREARRRLVRVEVAKGAARATGSVDLVELLERSSADERKALGLAGGTRDLDLEALAARDGALYIGLKAPVDGEGRAQIWKIARPERLLAGDLGGAQVAIWQRLALRVEADGRTVPGGIADMVFLDADTLLVAATAAGIDPGTQRSALYAVRVRGDAARPVQLRAFADLKAEGLALAPGGAKLAVVFDRGGDPAMWLELPLAAIREELRGAR